MVGGYRHRYVYTEPAKTTATILAVHGFGTSGYRTYRHVAARLSDAGIRLIAPDLLGFGDSESPEIPYSLDLYADLLSELSDELALERPIILGHSLGGKIAAATAVRHADRFSGLVLANPGGFSPTERVLPFIAAHPVFHSLLQADWFYYRVLPRTMLGPIFQSDENRLQMTRLRRSHVDLDLRRTGYRAKLASLPLPVLVLWGMADRILPLRTTKRIQRLIPAGRLRLIPGAGHAPMKDKPERFAAELIVFCREMAIRRET